MPAVMVVYMNITDSSWMEEYFKEVPKILAEYGAISLAGGRDVRSVEGTMPPPGRIAVLSFPSLEAIDRFMEDPRYSFYREARESGTDSNIFIFDNLVKDGELQ